MKRMLLRRMVNCASLSLLGWLLAGCATGNYTPVVRFGALNLETQVPRRDLVILDTVEGSSRQDTYLLGLVQIVDGAKWEVLGVKFFEDHCALPGGPMAPCWLVEPVAGRAYYNALEKTPNADALIERSSTVKLSGCPLFYERREVTCRGKAIKLKAQ
ncbi:MAG: hypothetical protein ABSF95_03010 [Verrucomicrobiota bacterium]